MADRFGAWLSKQLASRERLQTELAQHLGMQSSAYLSQVKSGAKTPSRAKIREIVKALANLTDQDEDMLLVAALEAASRNEESGSLPVEPGPRGQRSPWDWKTRPLRPKLGALDLPPGNHAFADEIAEDLVRRPALHFQSLYSLPRSACWFVSYESREAEEKKTNEAQAWTDLGVRETLLEAAEKRKKSDVPTIGVVGLAVGEGQGEIELLRRILHGKSEDEEGPSGPTPSCVHYMAVDLSPVLLTCHISNVRQTFAAEIKKRRLIVSAVTGNIFRLKDVLKRAREDVASRYSLDRPEDFMPEDIGIVATYLGNCLGNQQPDPSEEVFVSLDAAFTNNRPLVLLLGISVIDKTKIEEYPPITWEFFLQAPYHVRYNLRLLHATDPDEFKLPCKLPALTEKDEAKVRRFMEKRCIPEFPMEAGKPNLTLPFGFKVARYQFVYRPVGEVRLVANDSVRRSAGDDIVLACIDKFDIESVRQVLNRKRYTVVEKTNAVTVHALGERHYEMLAVYFS